MMDTGRPPLAAISAIGNWWHGYYSTSQGWRSRAGTAMPGFTPNTNANSRAAGAGDAHLVDFGRPAVTTPTAEADRGMERWNKAVLHGAAKYYSVLSGLSFGASGWPYRCADGTVYFLRAAATFASPNNLTVLAGKLTPAFTEPATVVASIAVPVISGVTTLNFAPDGSHAAAHSYDSNYETTVAGNTVPYWIVEIAVSGGSASVLPTVTLSLNADGAVDIEGAMPNVALMKTAWTLSTTTYENVTATTRDKIETYTASAVQADAYDANGQRIPGAAVRPLSPSAIYDAVAIVAYAPSGARRVLRRGDGLYQNYAVPTLVSSVPFIYRQPQALVGGVWTDQGTPTTVQTGYSLWDQEITVREIRRLSVNGSAVATLETTRVRVERGTVDPVVPNQNYQHVGDATVVSGPAVSGSGWNGTSSVTDAGVPFRFRRPASNVLAMIVESSLWSLLGWAAPHGSGAYTYSAPHPLTDQRMPAIHPETGAFDPAIRLYF